MTITSASTGAPTAHSASGTPASSATALAINTGLAARVQATEQAILASGGNLSNFEPPNLHQAPPLAETHGHVVPLYYVAPAPMGVAYLGLENTTGTVQALTTNTTSVVGTFQGLDSLQTAAYFNSGNPASASYGTQLNLVLVNVTLQGQTAFGASSPTGNDPNGCPTTSFWEALPGNVCPNEFWVQNYFTYTPSTGSFSISNEIWNFSNPTADWSGTGTNTIEGFGHTESSEVYQGPSVSVTGLHPPFSVDLYINYTQGPCHLDTTAGSGVPSCGPASTTKPNNELFLNYTIINQATGKVVCPATESAGHVCGEDDDVFFNSVGASSFAGVPAYGPHHRVGSATIQANGTTYSPLGLPNDYEMDYAIGDSGGETNLIHYQDGLVGVYYCQDNGKLGITNALRGGKCTHYSAPPAAEDFGSETGETSTGESVYWSPGTVSGVALANPALAQGSPTPVAHEVTGPSNLIGLWNDTGSPCVGANPTCPYAGAEPLSYAKIAPANAWVAIARDNRPGVEVTNQSYFQVAPTFGFDSSWSGSGGTTVHKTPLGSNLYLPTGWYTIEVLLSGYAPVIQQIDLTGPMAPSITLTPDYALGAYTPDWAFSNGDLANLSVSPSNAVPNGGGTSGNPYIISAGPPDIGAPFGIPGSLAWVFSNTNDYYWVVWMGAFTNSTTAVTQFNPAPSFPIIYPSWQEAALSLRYQLPYANGLQYYLYDSQNIAIIGASDISAWGATPEGVTVYSVVVNNCANVLIANNTFYVSNRGIDFTGGGTTNDYRTINGVNVYPTLKPAINVVFGNKFIPFPQSLTAAYAEAFTPQDTLTIAESFDRVYNNAFEAYGVPIGSAVPVGTLNATVSATSASDTDYWNATCQAGYHPNQGGSYPPATVCEPLSYSQSLDGFTMSGSILPGATFVGGNYWAGFGSAPDPYANIPYKARLTSVTGTAEIGATTKGFAGDYAPLLDPVYSASFTETGLTSSSTATSFEVNVTNSAGHNVDNESATSATPAGCSSGVCLNFYLPNGAYSYVAATTQSGKAPSPATGSFTVSNGAVSPIAITYSTGYKQTFTETGLHTGVTWLVTVSGYRPYASTSTTDPITLANGVYSYTYSYRDNVGACYTGGSGSLTVSSAATSPSMPFTVSNYCVLFAESGLPAGTTWTVTLAGTPESQTIISGTSYIGFQEPTGGPYAYQISSVTGYSESALPATGTVTVNGAAVTETTAAYSAFSVYPGAILNPLDVGWTTYIYAVYSGGTGPYSETWSGLPAGCSSAVVATTAHCTPTASGTYTVGLTFTDAQGNAATGSFVLSVGPALSPGTVSATPNPLDLGHATTISTSGASGGQGGYWYTWWGLPDGCSSAGASFSCTPSDDLGSPYSVVLTVTDGAGDYQTSTFQLTVHGPLSVSPSANLNPTQEGAPTTISAGDSGGSAPYTYVWGGLPSDCQALATTSSESFTCAPEAGDAGTYTVTLTETDSGGGMASGSFSWTIDSGLVASLTPATATTQPGEGVTFSPSTTGGVAPVTATLQASCRGLSGDVFTPTSGPETCTVYYNATDFVGSTSQATATVTVTASLATHLTPSTARIDVGQIVTFFPSTTGGVAPVTTTLQASCPGLLGVVFTPTSPETCTIYYNATDFVGSHSQATATVTVTALPVAYLTPATATTQPGEGVTFSPSTTGGAAPVTATLQASCKGLSGDVFTPLSGPETCTIYYNATDAVGISSQATATVMVTASLATHLTPGTATIDVGQTVTFSRSTTGGVAPVTTTLQASCKGLSGDVFTPLSGPETCTIYYNATDSVGSHSQATATVTVDPALSAGTPGAVPNPVTVNEPTTISTTASGGSGTYTYLWTGLPSSCSSTAASFVCTPTVTGTYTVTVQVTDGNGNTATASFSLDVTPVPVYLVTFTESNLPTNTMWYVNISDEPSLSGTGTQLSVYLPNGHYTYKVGVVNKHWASPAGSFTVSSATLGLSVPFTKQTFSLTFTESGPTLTKAQAKTFAKKGWTVVLNGTLMHSTGTTISFPGLVNGSYPVLVYGPSGYDLTGSGTVTVKGTTGVAVTVTKGTTYTLTFKEKGLKHKPSWCVTLDGVQECTTKGTLKFVDLTPGTYGYTVQTATGYTVTPTSGTLTLTSSQTVLLTFTKSGGSVPSAGELPAALSARGSAGSAAAGLGVSETVLSLVGLVGLLGAAVVLSRRRAPGEP